MRTAPPVYLSGQLGRPVHSSDGVHIGRVVDLTVLYDIAHPIVHRLAVGRARRIHYLLPWLYVATDGDEQVVLAVDQAGLSTYASLPDPNLEARNCCWLEMFWTPKSSISAVVGSHGSPM
jgi:hypothetical protein